MKLLYLVHRIPYPPNRGDRIRSYHLLRHLAARHDVWLACLSDEPTPDDHLAALEAWCERVAVVRLGRTSRWLRATKSLAFGRSASEGLFASPDLKPVIDGWTQAVRFDAAIAFCSSMVPYLRARSLKNVPAVIDLVDVDSEKWRDYAKTAAFGKRQLFALEGRRVGALEHEAARRATALATVSEAEASLCRENCAPTPVHGISNGVDLDYFGAVPPLAERAADVQECVFVGALDYRANIDGLVWFCREVWPELRRRHPKATFTAVGRKPAPAVRRLAELPGVSIAADVPDVRPYLARATAVAAPLRVARGIQNKVLEAMAARRPVVASGGALEGIDLEIGRHALQADSSDEWVAALSKLFEDRQLRIDLAAAGRTFVEAHHSWESRLKPFDDLLAELRADCREPAPSTSC